MHFYVFYFLVNKKKAKKPQKTPQPNRLSTEKIKKILHSALHLTQWVWH